MTRAELVDAVIALLKQGDESQTREYAEALVGMGVALFDQLGVPMADVHTAIDRRIVLS